MEAITLIPYLMLLAQVSADNQSWFLTLANYGVAGVMLIYFIWRDRRTEGRWDAERQKANEVQSDNTKALNLMTRALMVQVIAIKHVDETARELAAKIKEEADAAIGSIK